MSALLRLVGRPACYGAVMAAALAGLPLAAEGDTAPAQLEQQQDRRDRTIADLEATVATLEARLARLEALLGEDRSEAASASPGPVPPPPGRGGGASAGQGLDVDPMAARRALEIVLSQDGALLLPPGAIEISPSVGWAYGERDFPIARIADGTLVIGESRIDTNLYNLDLNARIGLPWGMQIEAGIPYRWTDSDLVTSVAGVPTLAVDGPNSSGFGNLRLGVAKTLLREKGLRPDVVARLTWDTGLGGDATGATPDENPEALTGSLTFLRRSDPLVLVATTNFRTTLGNQPLQPADQFGFSLGTAFAASAETSLFASLNSQFAGQARFNGTGLAGSDIKAVSINLGIGTIIAKGMLMNVVTGVGLTEDAPDLSLGLSATMRIR